MAVSGVATQGALSSYAVTSKQNEPAEDKTSLDMSDFYELMAAQMKYQDMDNPADTSQMLTMMVQSQMIQAITNMSYTNTTSYAASLVGKEVTVAETDMNGSYTGDKSGVVTGVILGDDPIILVDGKSYSLSQLMAVGEVPETNSNDGTNGTQNNEDAGNNGEGSNSDTNE